MEILLATLLALASAIPAVAIAVAVPAGCPSSCGDLTITYPFGIGTGCFHEGFEITCQTTNTRTSKVANLAGTSFQVLNLSLDIAEVRVNLPIAWQCYGTSGVEGYYTPEVQFDPSVYRISNTHNKLVVIGCNSLAYMKSQYDGNGLYSYDYYTGCVSYCNDTEGTIDGSCSGVGCCQVAIRSNLSDSRVHFDAYTHNGFLSFSRCSYAFLVDKDWYRFGKSDLTMNRNTSMPMLLDWALRENSNCAEAQASQAYGCRSRNSECYESSNGPGYLCNCTKGYQGNPYLEHGCVDIDECGLPDLYPCHGICRNKPGSYDCTCPSGKHGNPFNNPCSPNIPLREWVTITSCAVVFVLVVILYRWFSDKKQRFSRIKERLILFVEKSRNVHEMKHYTEEELAGITKNFHNKIGTGSFGIVYKGNLEDHREVAVKKSIKFSREQEKEFINEMIIVSQIDDDNVVRLVGCCLVGAVPSLVYEYIPKGDLCSYLQKNLSNIDLKTRLQIATDSAKGLTCLHSTEIVHGDVKSNNILLDSNLRAKISDFGTSKFLPKDKAINTTLVTGTNGYRDPMYLATGKPTKESDVYSFGVVILELITGKVAMYQDRINRTLVGSYKTAVTDDNIEALLDRNIFTEENRELLVNVAKFAGQCLELKGAERPTMGEVAKRLEEFWTTLQAPPILPLLIDISPENRTRGSPLMRFAPFEVA